MSTERIKQLHDQATERYLGGDYAGALQSWRDILALDPKDEQALGGLRLASQFVEQDSPRYTPEMNAVEHELDQGLTVLDSLGGTAPPRRETVARPLEKRHDAKHGDELESLDILDGWEMPKDSAGGEGSFGLEPITRSSPAPGTAPAPPPPQGMSAAAAELGRRVKDLLGEAKARAEAGERDDALAILARLSILDEDNAEAAVLRSRIESESSSDLDKVENAIIEGVAALETGRLDDAERFLGEALAMAPDHREARHYLEQVVERRRGGDEDLLAALTREAPPAENAVQFATAVDIAPRKRAPEPVEAPPAAEPPQPQRASRVTLPPPKFLIWAGVGVVLLAGAAIGLPLLLGGSAPEVGATTPATSTPRPKRPAKTTPPAKGEAPAVAVSPEAAAKIVASGVSRGRASLDSGDFGKAVIAFNDALAVDPKNAEARAGLEDAGARYKASKVERDTLNNIALAFRDGEYASALRMIYRLPPSVSKSYIDGAKVAGWYNLAVVALRAGECREAISHLDEALEIVPRDVEATKLREFASHYVDAVKDRAFLDRVEALTFLPLPPS